MPGEVWGRDSELALTDGALGTLTSDSVAVILGGEEGMGKTALWEQVLTQAEGRGCRVLSARPVESEAKFAFAALADLLRDSLDEVVLALPDPQRAALEGALLRVDTMEGSPDPRAVAFGFYSGVLSLAGSGPLVLAVDDVQWLDAPSARVLEFSLRRLEGKPVGVVLAARTAQGPSQPSPLGLDSSPLQERTHRITVGPLGLEVLRQILRSKLRVRFPQWVLGQIHEASGGNPLFALELARALVRSGADPDPGQALPIPRRLAELLADRLSELSESVRLMLLCLSAAVQPTLPSICRALGDPPGFPEDVEAALQADVIAVSRERVQFTSPMIGTALYSGATPEERRHAHRILAEIAVDPEEQARHLALAADAPDESVAQLLEDAAQRARSRGAPEAAAELAELARGLTPERKRARARSPDRPRRAVRVRVGADGARRGAAPGGRVGGADGTDAGGGAAVPQPCALPPARFGVGVDTRRRGTEGGEGGSLAPGEHPSRARGRRGAVRRSRDGHGSRRRGSAAGGGLR